MSVSLPVKYSFPFLYRQCIRFFPAFLVVLFLLAAPHLQSQSTYGSIVGTVQDNSGAVIPGATITVVNTGTTTTRISTSDASGNFTFGNIDVGNYSLTIAATGFEKYSLPEITITARESRHIDAKMQLGAENQTVTVEAQAQNVITTEVSNLAETKMGEELVNLPVAIYSRSTGSTSPISTLTTEAGVQTDDNGNLSVMGTTPALMSVTLDGISSVNVESSGPNNEMFPSFNSIEEIRVSESNNNAEFSGVADITTVSKAGTGKYHGGVFENHQNTIFNAGNPFTGSKPKIIMNDFGGTLGGPVSIPHLYNGRDRSFFFISFEGLRLPRESPTVVTVPTDAMRGDATGFADVSGYLANENVSAIYQPDGKTSIDPTHVAVTPTSAKMLTYLFPKQNFGGPAQYAYNYRANLAAPISANQGDVRLDQTITSKQTVFARFSYKNRQVVTTPETDCGVSFCQTGGGLLQGSYNVPEIDEGLTFAHNYVITPHLLNEFRGGYNALHTSTNQNFSTTALLSQLGLLDVTLQPDTAWAEAPQVAINGFVGTGGGNPTRQRSQIIQLLDNVSWTKQHHTLKFGGDMKRLSDYDTNVFGNYTSGIFAFDGSSTVGTNIGDPYTSFLLGYPDYTETATIKKPEMDGLGYSYAVFAQDDWKVTPNLTLNLGLRYELHPPLKEVNYNTAFFLPDYTTTVNGQSVAGAVVVPNQQSIGYVDPNLAMAISPTPFLTAKQAGLPETLRYTDKNDWGPRIGFAWRPYGNDKTVVRGGWGQFIETPLGFSLVSGWAVHASYVGVYSQGFDDDGVTPQLSLANPYPAASPGSTTGTAGFYYAFPIHYKDPSVQQWNMTVEQDLGHGIGLRLSYTGSHGKNLETMVDLNQVHANTDGYYNTSSQGAVNPNTTSCITDDGSEVADHRPYPCWSVIQSVENLAESNYNSAAVEVSRHSGKGLTFDASYLFTRDLSDAAGATPSSFVAAGGNFLTDRFHPGLDYGNVAYDRKHRFLVTYLYDLPFGRGQHWLSGGGVLNALVGDWHLGGVTILQSGPFLTPYQASVDPANTNILTTIGQTRSDQLQNVSLYAPSRTVTNWLNPNAFPYLNLCQGYSATGICNGVGIGRFGNAPVGGVVGPGTANFSVSLRKGLAIREKTKFEFTAEAANLFNHRNYEPPNMQLDSGAFGQISALQTAEGAGPRSMELGARITF